MLIPKSYNFNPQNVFDVMIIGSGIAGMAASLFAVNRKLSVVQAGSSGGTLFTSGLLDLMAVYPLVAKKLWENPWEAIDALRKDGTKHPYTRISNNDIQDSYNELVSFLDTAGMKFICDRDRNSRIITSMGTLKYTYGVPESMWNGVEALKKKAPCVIVDFEGLKEFSAQQVALTLQEIWPAMRPVRIVFPGMEKRNEVHAVHLARALELSETRQQMARLIAPHIGDAEYIGFPAILGIKRTRVIHKHLEELLKVRIFEIPTMPASVPGFRLKEIFDSELPRKGLLRLVDKRVRSVILSEDGNFLLGVGEHEQNHEIRARSIILASGRFMGKGLTSDRNGIYEPLFNLPLYMPEKRALWHEEQFLNPAGHPINSAGVEVDHLLRPVDATGGLIHDNLYAAGSILAHQDWIRMKCGSGLAIASAYVAVKALIDNTMNNSIGDAV